MITVADEHLMVNLADGAEELVKDFLSKHHLMGLREISQPDTAIWTAQIAIFESMKCVPCDGVGYGVHNMLLTGRGSHVDGSALLIVCAIILGVPNRCLGLVYNTADKQSRVSYNNGMQTVAIDWHDERCVKCYTQFKAQFNGQYKDWLHAQA